MSRLIELDGSILEGGGQILRNAMAFSCILKKPIAIDKIRANRSNPGLRAQHLHGIQLVSKLCDGQLKGDTLKSSAISFSPNTLKADTFKVDPGTAGSICLLIQVSLPCMLLAPGPCFGKYIGGTNSSMAPQVDFCSMVFKPTVERFGIYFEIDIKRRGYFPRGGGEVFLRTTPVEGFQSIEMLDKGDLTHITGRAFVAGALGDFIPKIMIQEASRPIKEYLKSIKREDVPIDIEFVRDKQCTGSGAGILIIAHTSTGCMITGSAVLEKKARAEAVGFEAGNMLVENLVHGGCTDEYLTDQLIIFMALADGVSRVRSGPLSLHTRTAIHFAEVLSEAEFTVTPDEIPNQDTYVIECTGIGYRPSSAY